MTMLEALEQLLDGDARPCHFLYEIRHFLYAAPLGHRVAVPRCVERLYGAAPHFFGRPDVRKVRNFEPAIFVSVLSVTPCGTGTNGGNKKLARNMF
jgi:hypothetical protein